jgi:hypothetical protein
MSGQVKANAPRFAYAERCTHSRPATVQKSMNRLTMVAELAFERVAGQ